MSRYDANGWEREPFYDPWPTLGQSGWQPEPPEAEDEDEDDCEKCRRGMGVTAPGPGHVPHTPGHRPHCSGECCW
jgi:hypothetical protein